jgi:uncharacterized protein (TIGR02246 family)
MKNNLLFLLYIFLLSCSQNEKATQVDVDEDEINSIYDRFSKAYDNLDAEMVKELYEENAIYFNPGDPVQFGRSTFIGSFEEMFASSKQDSTKLDIQFRILDRKIVSDDQVIDIGYFRLEWIKDTNSLGLNVGKFITILHKQPDDTWKFIIDAYNQAPVEVWE